MGVMVDSIESPHGDQIERIAVATATTAARPTRVADTETPLDRVNLPRLPHDR